MSFLAGRLASTEGAYFRQESKQAVSRLVEKNKKIPSSSTPRASSPEETQADVLPEVLRHSLPPNFAEPISDSSISRAAKWVIAPDPKNVSNVSPDAKNPLRAYVSLPQVTFGPRRWEMPVAEHSILASTANDLRRDSYRHHVDPEKLKAAAEGLSQIGKAFAVATGLIFGGATLMLGLAASKLKVHNADDIRTKGRELVQPNFDRFREHLTPLKTWGDNMSRKWHLERENTMEKPILKELSKKLNAKTSN